MGDAKQGKQPVEDFHNGSSQSRVVLAKPRLGGFGSFSIQASSSSKSCNPFGSVLRPSTLKPGNNPFLKVNEPQEETNIEKEKETDESEDRLKDKDDKEEDTPKFVPLGSAIVTARTAVNPVPAPAQPASSSSSSGFVFGQNLSERVVIQENINNGDVAPEDHSSSNGTTDLLFTNAAASVKENTQEEPAAAEAGASGGGGGGEGLAAAAAEYERSHARPPPPSVSHTVTGEEGETNVLQISCRLFAWESGSWRERGRGVLRLNDGGTGTGTGTGAGTGAGAARLVARVAGSLRVVLNTKLWPDMVVQRAGTKSLRITAADAQQQIKLFLIMGAPGDIVQLYRALTARIALSKRTVACAQNVPSQQAAERLEAATDDSEFADKPDAGAQNPTADKGNGDIGPDEQSDAKNDRLEETDRKTDEPESTVDIDSSNDESKLLKRKEPAEDATPSKRPCPEVTI